MCDSHGNPLRFILTEGQAADCKQALALLEGLKADAVLADKGYDADYIVQAVGDMGAVAVIPPKSNRIVQREYDEALYKERNLVERMFNVPFGDIKSLALRRREVYDSSVRTNYHAKL